MNDLKQKISNGVMWQISNKLAQKVLSVFTFAILARVLDPSIFGLFAMAFILIDGLAIFESVGIDGGIVQRKNSTELTYHTAFILMMIFGFFITVLCFLMAPVVGAYFNNAAVVDVIQALGVIFIISSLTRVPKALLIKQMQFRRIAYGQFAGAIVNSSVALFFAFVLQNVWCLVVAYLAKQVTILALYWMFSDYQYKFAFSAKEASKLLRFGIHLAGVNVISYIAANINTIIIVKLFSESALGIYVLAANIGRFVNTHFLQHISQVLFPAYSSIQNNIEYARKGYLKTVSITSAITFPLSVILILLSDELIMLIYGPKWTEAVILVQIFGVSQLLSPLIAATSPLFNAFGKPKYALMITTLAVVIKFPLIFLFCRDFGLVGVLIAQLISRVISCPLALILTRKLIGFSYRAYMTRIFPAMMSAAVMACSILVFKSVVQSNYGDLGNLQDNLFFLGSSILISFPIYFSLIYYLDRKTMQEVLQLLKGKINAKPVFAK